MKFGSQLERESVPQWSLHNLDYNSLKHEIKVHTTRDQATAMAIPGHQDPALRKFEDNLYQELWNQHDRVGLFVSSKADEISRRLEHLSANIERWIDKYTQDATSNVSLKRQRRFAKYERELLQCGEEILALSRFASAQIIAFRKILKKYRKWTASTTLTVCFNENVLADPKSFTRRDFSHLQARHDEILQQVRDAAPLFSEPSSPSSIETRPISRRPSEPAEFEPLPPSQMSSQTKYWNEYDDGSENGDAEDEYAIYIDPNGDASFPGLGYLQAAVAAPYEKAKQWFRVRGTSEQRPLLQADPEIRGYASIGGHLDSEEEDYASSDGMPSKGYATLYALPSLSEQRAVRYREKALLWGTIGCFGASFIVLGIAGLLMSTGRRRLRVEVDAGVTVGVMASLFCACSGLGMTLYRGDRLSMLYQAAVWSAFVALCMFNSMLLILMLQNVP